MIQRLQLSLYDADKSTVSKIPRTPASVFSHFETDKSLNQHE